MTDEFPQLGEGRTPAERDRLAKAREQIAAIGDVPGVEVKLGYIDDMAEAIDAQEAAVFCGADAFTFKRLDNRLSLLPCIEVSQLDWVEEALREKQLRCDIYGIGNEIEGVEVPLFAHFRFAVRRVLQTPVYITIDDAPEEWKRWAMRRFALVFPLREDETREEQAWLATGPLRQHPEGFVLPGKLGRNDLCPCGSGKKAKRCCLA